MPTRHPINHHKSLLLTALALSSLAVPCFGQSSLQLRAVPPAPRQPNYVMLDAKPVADSEEAPEATPNNDPSHVGLKLHGHWVIDVLNPDHSLAHHHDFENSIQPLGSTFLLGLLGGYYSSGNPAIILMDASQSNGVPCLPTNANTQYPIYSCEMVRSTATEPGLSDCAGGAYALCASTLAITFTPFNGQTVAAATLVLVGNITANQAGTVSEVQTEWSLCTGSSTSTPTTTSPTTCQAVTSYGSGTSYATFTATFPSAIAVASGQIIQVTITFTIS